MATEMDTTQDVLSITRFAGAGGLSVQLSRSKLPVHDANRYIVIHVADIPAIVADLLATYNDSVKAGYVR